MCHGLLIYLLLQQYTLFHKKVIKLILIQTNTNLIMFFQNFFKTCII